MPAQDDHLPNLPQEQQRIRDKCYHPTGLFVEFKKADTKKSILHCFERVVDRYPDRLAIKSRYQQLTYGELNRSANWIAHRILKHLEEGQKGVAIQGSAGQ